MPVARLADGDLAFDVAGEGPPLLMVMGLASTRHHWYGLDQALARLATTITFDNRGTGESSGAAPRTLSEMANDALGLLDHLGIGEAHVLGVSMGGMIAQRLALSHPERIKRLVLGCTHHGGASQVRPAREVLAKVMGFAGRSPPVAPEARANDADVIRAFFDVCFSGGYRARHPDVYARIIGHEVTRRVSSEVLTTQLEAIAAHDTAAALAALRIPTLVITGDEDELVPSGNAQLLAQLLRQAELVLIPGAGHVFWCEAPEAAYDAIGSFLAPSAFLDSPHRGRHIRASP